MNKRTIIYFLPDEALGVASIVKNLLEFRERHSDIYYKVILTRQIEREAQHIDYDFDVNEQIVFKYSGDDNLVTVFKRLKHYIPDEQTILVANDGLELRMINYFKLNNPLIYIIHGDFDYYYKISKLYQGIIDKIISYSLYTKYQLTQQLLKENIPKVELLYYPVPEKVNKVKLEKTIDLLFVGAFVKRKGVQFLPEIYERVKAKLGEVSFALAGFGSMEDELKSNFNNESSVAFLGKLSNEDVFKTMSNSKILIFPSLSEGLPNVVVEAMKSQCVPICSDINSGIPDLIDDGVEGFRVAVGDVTNFASRIITLLKDEQLRSSMALNAAKKAHYMFEPLRNAAKYERAILETVPLNKYYVKGDLGRLLNHPLLPNVIVRNLRKLRLSSKL